MDASTPAQRRASAAEHTVLTRRLHRYGPVAWAHASTSGGPGARTWHYWWHAHLLHVLADAARHRPSASRDSVIAAVRRGVTLRTAGRWTTPYYDDIAWMGLALAGAGSGGRAQDRITRRLAEAADRGTGILPWRVGSALYNAPANAPGAMVLLAGGHERRAARIDEWMASVLDDPATGLVRDGVEDGIVRPELWTYNQGAVIGLALARHRADADPAHLARAGARVRAVQRWCAPDDGLFPAAGGGDGGLFAGILARYLAEAARVLTGPDAAMARRLVLRNAEALWAGRTDGLFPADPRRAAGRGEDADLSVQLGAWITLEAAVALER